VSIIFSFGYIAEITQIKNFLFFLHVVVTPIILKYIGADSSDYVTPLNFDE